MKYFFFFLVSISGYGQKVLKAGTFENQRFSEPIVLDTGSFIFKEISFTIPPSGVRGPEMVWLDARKARRVQLLDCSFMGDNQGTAVLPAEKTRIKNCRFQNLETGILVESGEIDSLVLEANGFENNAISICSDASDLLLEMKGNVFLTDENNDRIGLKLGPKATLKNSIGSNGHFINPPPAGNIWPVAGEVENQDTIPFLFLPLHEWISRQAPAKNWQSLVNCNPGFELRYFRYDNEFVSGVEPNGSVLVHSNFIPSFQYVYSKKDSSQLNQARMSGNWFEIDTYKNVTFPSKTWFSTNPRHRIDFAIRHLSTSDKHIVVGDIINDLTNGLAFLPVFVPGPLVGKTRITVKKQGSQNEIFGILLQSPGKQLVKIPATQFEKGLYLYGIEMDGRMESKRQWVKQ